MRKKNGIGYRTAWNHYKLGLIPNARKLPTGMMSCQLNLIKRGETYRHFRAGIFKVRDVVIDSETLSTWVLYEELGGTSRKVCARSLCEFSSGVGNKDEPRFERVG